MDDIPEKQTADDNRSVASDEMPKTHENKKDVRKSVT